MPERTPAFSKMPASPKPRRSERDLGRISGVLWILAALIAVVDSSSPAPSMGLSAGSSSSAAPSLPYGLASRLRPVPVGAGLDEFARRSAWC